MIRVAGLVVALAVLPLSSALAQTSAPAASEAAQAAGEASIEAAAAAFEARMEAFGKRAEAISLAGGLTEAQREARMAALWSEYQPEVAVFTAAVTQHAGAIASAALADIDLKAIIDEALNDPEVQQTIAGAQTAGMGIATNSAWVQHDPEQMVTYGLMAQYGMDQAMDALEADQDAEDADAAPEPPAPPARPTPPVR